MHFLYIIRSEKLNRFYVGESEQPKIRVEQHNSHYFKTNFTKAANDWKLALTFECKSKEDALYLEKFIKRMKSKNFIEKVIQNPTILKDVLTKQ